MSDPFLGEIRFVGFTFAPYGWALCQAQLLPVNQNAALFSLLGTTYGGNGQTTFGLPDLQGRSPVGTGTGANLTPINPGDKGGTESFTLTLNQLPNHTHTATGATAPVSLTSSISIPATTATAGGTNVPSNTAILGGGLSGGHPATLYNTGAATTTLLPFNNTASGNMTVPAPTIGATGNGLPLPLRNPYLGLTSIIALQGIFPSRG